MRASVVVLAFFIAVPLVHSQQPSKPARPAAAQPATSAEDTQTRQELERMKALVQQMQTNLAFVTTIQGPLKHQFELEIEMWQLEIARMERRLGTSQEDGAKAR